MQPELIRRIATSIAAGHAYQKHVVAGNEFGRRMTVDQFADLVEIAIAAATDKKTLRRDRTAYYYQPKMMIVIYDPKHEDLGSAFVAIDRYRRFIELR